MAIDCVIRGGTVVDGSGEPARRADIGIDGGRIVAVGKVDEFARETLDADGCIVTPGFIDPHTHLDAQLCWDPEATPTSLHGVTSVVMGLCGFGVAPCPAGVAWARERLGPRRASHDPRALRWSVVHTAGCSRTRAHRFLD